MALDPSTASTAIATAYLLFVGLDEDGEISETPPQGDYPAAFASGYNDYAKEGLVLGADNSGGDASIIENFMRAVSGTPATIVTFAEALAAFWATVAVDPGIPSHGGLSVVSVENDAASHVADFVAAIQASVTTQESKPYFLDFVTNVEVMAVSKIIWTVTELMPGSPPYPASFPEGVL